MASAILSLMLFLLGGHTGRAGAPIRAAAEVTGPTVHDPAANQAAARERALKAYAALPLSFEPNQGQAPRPDRFVAHAPGYALALRADEAALELQKAEGSGQKAESSAQALRQATDHGPRTTDDVLRMTLIGANAQAQPVQLEKLPGISNYYIGNDPDRWLTGISNYQKVGFNQIYPGVDVRYYGTQGRLEYDFVVAPNADPSAIQMAFHTASKESSTPTAGGRRQQAQGSAKSGNESSILSINSDGDLVVKATEGELIFHKPVVYQESEPGISNLKSQISDLKSQISNRKSVDGNFVLLAKNRVGFRLGPYDHSRPLTVDPLLIYSTYLGGNLGDTAFAIAVDASDEAYVVGRTGSSNFPTAGSPVFQGNRQGTTNAFVTKLVTAGTSLSYSTYLGGSGSDTAYGVAVDTAGNAYVVGTTSSSNFPVLPAANSSTPAFQATYGGGTSDAFVSKFSATGGLNYSSFLGGTDADYGTAIAVDSAGNAYLTGSTSSSNLPVVAPFQPALVGDTDAFVAKVNPTGTALTYSTYLGGDNATNGQGVAVDTAGFAYVTGYTFSSHFPIQNAIQGTLAGNADTFVTKFAQNGQTLVFSTYLGGTLQDRAWAIALDTSANVYITGDTQSSGTFPVTNNAYQRTFVGKQAAFVTELTTSGQGIVYSTYLGGGQVDQGTAIAVDTTGDAWVTGFTENTSFPTAQPIIANFPGGNCPSNSATPCTTGFVSEIGPLGTTLPFSTFLGGSSPLTLGYGVAVDATINVFVAGVTESAYFTPVAGAFQGAPGDTAGDGDAFVAEISLASGEPAVALTPQKYTFANQVINTQSTPQVFTLTNVSTAPLSVTSVVSGNSDFVESNNCVGTVAPSGGTCTISVVFTPTTLTTETAQITITDNATAATTQAITVTGTGENPTTTISLNPTGLTFFNQSVNTTSPQQTITVTNTGTTNLTLTGITSTGDFAETNNCPASPAFVAPGSFCSIFVTFTPTTTGTRTGNISIAGDFTPSPATVSLTGTGISGFSLTVPQQTQVLTIGTTSATYQVGTTAPSNLNGTVVTLGCSNLPSTAVCTFTPTTLTIGQPGTSTLVVSGLSGSTPNPSIFQVTGTGTPSGQSQQTATLNLTLVFSDFSVVASPNNVNIAAGNSATYTVTVTPSNGFNQAVLLSCPQGLPQAATCVFSPSAVSLNGTTATTSTLTVTTTARTTTSQAPPAGSRRVPPGTVLMIVGLGLLLTVAARWAIVRRKPVLSAANAPRLASRRRLRPALALFAVLLIASLSPGCDYYFPNLISPAPGSGTPAGNYQITIVGTLSGTTTVIHATVVNLGVS